MPFGHMLDGVLWIPVDRDGPDYWDSEFGPDEPEPEPRRRYSTLRLSNGEGPYQGWEDFLARTSEADRMRSCAAKAKVANRWWRSQARITVEEVWAVLERARGRCCHCDSLALENRPSDPRTGAPLPWERIGRRIGSLEHVKGLGSGGENRSDNLAWACLWCNGGGAPEVQRRRKGARDHGGYYPAERHPLTTRRYPRAALATGQPLFT